MTAALPTPIAEYLGRNSAASRRPAWLLVERTGTTRASGGDLGAYGLESVRAGACATEQVPFLEGLLPVGADPLYLPWLELQGERYADVYVLPDSDGDWILLLDATRRARRALPVQQQRNDTALSHERTLIESLQGVFGGEDCLVLLHDGRDTYHALEPLPAWVPAAVAGASALRPGEVFPYLRTFLPEAQSYCRRRRPGSLSAGPWVQSLEEVGDLHLEAWAVCLRPSVLALFVAPVGESVRAQQRLLQSAREQKLAHERLSRDIERKDVLAHCVVHDLKGPLSCIQGYLQLARSGVATESQNLEFLDMALRQCRRQERLIRDLLDVFASDNGVLAEAEAAQDVVLADAVRAVVTDLRPGFEQAHCTLELEVDPDVEGVRVPGERSRMERVFANLLENALRYTPSGSCARVALHHAGAELVACVENEGKTISEALRPRLFERFTQGGTNRGSSGLGLFFCRITLERWGGHIGYRPRTGGGSCFEMRLPLAGS